MIKQSCQNSRKRQGWLLLALTLTCIGCDPFSADVPIPNLPKTLYVSAISSAINPNGTSRQQAFASVQQAVHAAKDGDTILIDINEQKPYQATNKQDAVIHIRNKRGLKLLGGRSMQDRPLDRSTLDGLQSFGNVLHVIRIDDSQDITITNFVVRKGKAQEGANEQDPDNWGAGILINNSKNIKLDNLLVTDNTAHWGAAVAVMNSLDVDLINCDLNNNRAQHRLIQQLPIGGKGGAIAVHNSQRVTITNTTVHNNSATNQAGALYGQNCHMKLHNSIFEANKAATTATGAFENLSGGAAFLYRCDCHIENSNWTNNQAQQAGALFADNTQLTLVGGTFSNNTSRGNAAAVLAQNNSTVAVRNVQFNNNSAQQNGGALSIVSGSRAVVERSKFTSNNVKGACPIILLSQENGWQDGGRNVYQKNTDSGAANNMAQGFFCKP
ncbi:MAG: hypothetical protein AAF310_00435 [Myxococcota bacterium]